MAGPTSQQGPQTPALNDQDGQGGGGGGDPGISVIICAFTQARWDALLDAVGSIAAQSRPALETIVVIDNNPQLLERARGALGGARVIANARGQGLSGARNAGIDAARGSVLAFLDDDAVADADWLSVLAQAFADEATLGAGGAVDPDWLAGRPAWFPREFDWVVGCAHNGMPVERTTVRNVIGANMAFRADLLRELGGFREGIGRVGSVPLGCEETDLCIRAQQLRPGGNVVYDPAARVRHVVPAARGTGRYFLSRCRAEGHSKALVARLVGSSDGLSAERDYTARTLPRGVARGLRDAVRGDFSGLARAAAIVVGLATTTLGYVAERLTGRGTA